MSPNTQCPHCGSVGFVRKEYVLKGEDEYTQFYCGHCNASWTTKGDEIGHKPKPRIGIESPDRSRS